MKGGESVRARRPVYGFSDAPLERRGEHRRGILERKAKPSALCPTLYVWYGEEGLEGSLGTHVDDDLMQVSDTVRAKYTNALRLRFPYGK